MIPVTPREAARQAILAVMPMTPDCSWDPDAENPYCLGCQQIAEDYAEVALVAYFRTAQREIIEGS